jgi:hypothetical protein
MVKMDYMQLMQQLSDIVNRYIAPFTDKRTSASDFFNGNKLFSLYGINGMEVFFDVFNGKAPAQKLIPQSLFHYKRFDLAGKFIENDYVTASALSNFTDETKKEDVKEYEHFFKTVNIGTDQSSIDKQKDDLFIFCLTDNNCTERFWDEYANKGKGLCLELEITYKPGNIWYDLNRICYDNDDENKFQFFADMQKKIHETFDKYLSINGLAKFGALYKRNRFAWEQETRLLIHKDNGIFKITETDNKKYMIIPFNNQLFSIKIKSVTLGNNLSNNQRKEIENLLKEKNIKLNECKIIN